MSSPLGRPVSHESAWRHVSGEAVYVDDIPAPRGMLHGMVLPSPLAHARILSTDVSKAWEIPGVRGVLTAGDIPGENNVGPHLPDEPTLATGKVHCVGQPVALVLAESREACRKALDAIEVDYEPLHAVLEVEEAITRKMFIGSRHHIQRGDVDEAIGGAPHSLSGRISSPSQEHFYLETQAALAIPGEGGTLKVWSSTQHPTEVQTVIGHNLGWPRNRVVVESPRMGGAFGGKESQAAIWATLASLGAVATGRPVKVWLDRDQDMTMTGHRHPFHTAWEVGFDDEGRLLAYRAEVFADGGWAADLSMAILDRGLFHCDNAYFIPCVSITGQVVRTNHPSNTAFRGFGAPQGMLVIEHVMERIAHHLGLEPDLVRARNFYGDAPRNQTPFGQEVADFRIPRMFERLTATAELKRRQQEIQTFNAANPYLKRALALVPVKFGISFTISLLNQAGALVVAYTDGSVQLNHGGTEMGQGLYTKMLQICAHNLGINQGDVIPMATTTEKVPNTSPTAASTGADLNGQAIKVACSGLVERLKKVAADMLGVELDALRVAAGRRESAPHTLKGDPAWAWAAGVAGVTFREVCVEAWRRQISLAETGWYGTPGIAYDKAKGRGCPFHYFAYGTGVSEVEVNGLTGEWRLIRADILHDVGDSLSPDIDRGQVEGAYIQGVGWLTCEELLWNKAGELLTRGPSTYKIPAVGDAPLDFRVELLDRAPAPGVIHGSKAVGEPPFCLGTGAWLALCRAVNSFAEPGSPYVTVSLPAGPEAILMAIQEALQT